MKAMLLIESEYVARILSWGGGKAYKYRRRIFKRQDVDTLDPAVFVVCLKGVMLIK